MALVYQFGVAALLAKALSQGLDPVAVGSLAVLSALGGVATLSVVAPQSTAARMVRALSGALCALCATLALAMFLPAPWLAGATATVLLGSLCFAATGAFARLSSLIWIAAAGLCWATVVDPLPTLTTPERVQFAALTGLCAVGVWRTHSVLGAAALAGLAAFAVGTWMLDAGQHPVVVLGSIGLAGSVLWAVGRLRSETSRLALLGAAVATLGAVGAQVLLADTPDADSLLQPVPALAALPVALVFLQGVLLVANLLSWLSGRLSWTGVVLYQLAAAALCFCLIDPSWLERLVPLPDPLSVPAVLGAVAGGAVLALAGVGAYRSWYADQPVRTGLFAMLIMVQLSLIVPLIVGTTALWPLALAALGASLLSVALARPSRRSDANPL